MKLCKKLFSGTLCVALLGSLLALPAHAVSGTVVKPDGTPLADAKVVCQIKENGVWRDWTSESYKIEGDLDGDAADSPDYSGLKEGAEDYGQSPSMFTDTDGRCGWMLPQGTFRFKVTADGYRDFTSTEFTVGTQSGNVNNSHDVGDLKLTSGSGGSGSGGSGSGSSGGYYPWLNTSGGSSDTPKTEPTPPAADARPGSLKPDAASLRYLAGYDDGTFRPNQPITRYEVAQALTYLLVLGDGSAASTFSDVPPKEAAAVSRLAEAGLINGMGDGTFRGENSLTRAQISKILCLVLDLEPDAQSAADSFSDMGRHWGAGYIGALTKAGHLKGYTDGTFRPDQPMTRAELAALLNRVAGRKDVADQAPEYTDVPAKFWGYEDIRNASLALTATEGS